MNEIAELIYKVLFKVLEIIVCVGAILFFVAVFLFILSAIKIMWLFLF